MSSGSDIDRRRRYGHRSESSELERVNSDGHSSVHSFWSSCRSPTSTTQTTPTTPSLWQPEEWNAWITRRAALRLKAKEASRRVEDQVIGPVYERIMGSLCDFPEKAARACAFNLLKMILMWGYFTYYKALNPKQARSGGDQMVRQLSQIGYPVRDDKEVRIFIKRLRRRMPLAEIMKKTFKRDIAIFDAILPVARKLGSLGIKIAVFKWLWTEKLEGRRYEHLSRAVLLQSIDQLQAAHAAEAEEFPRDQAERLKRCVAEYDNDNLLVEFLRLNWELGWHLDVKSLEAERYILAKFIGDAEYPRWVCSKGYYAFESATAPIKYYNRVVVRFLALVKGYSAEHPSAMPKKNQKASADASSQSVDSHANTKKGAKGAAATAPPSPALVICRNKHWRYISSFHGPWLQLPLEVLETLANANYYMPLPRPVDPAVFYDLVKIRQLVDNATDLAVRAANGITTSPKTSSLAGGAAHQMAALGLGFGQGGMKLSPERRHKLREQATQKLSKAYRIDEIASSVATMQSTSTLENVAALVLQRAPNDADANYVNFFHEKIPSRQLAECTDLHTLDSIISQRPADCEPLRTRAIVRMFKEDFEGAARDLTSALNVFRLHQQPSHKLLYENKQLERRNGRRRELPSLDERDQPSSTEVQILFQRAGCYLTLACDHVEPSLPQSAGETTPRESVSEAESPDATGNTNGAGEQTIPDASASSNEPTEEESRNMKRVRLYAKRALRDYMAYLEPLHYSPDMPIELSDDFTRQVNQANNRGRRYRGQNLTQDPADLPLYPVTDLVTASSPGILPSTTEMVTYHPLLTDALHSLLLCHALIQTSSKELQRHAHMVARLARLADGYPVFQASRSPARADWIEVLRRAENWIELSTSWEFLCAPAPLPTQMSLDGYVPAATANANALALTGGKSSAEAEEEERKKVMQHKAIVEALEDERVHDEASFKAAILARQRRAEADLAHANAAPATNGNGNSASSPVVPSQKRWAVDDGREYPILTERAEAVARWVREAPAGAGVTTTKRKKRPGRKPTVAAPANSTESLDSVLPQRTK
ncbi:uncharacterized protein PG986_012535 [Apiospora aurea]|uniref:Uncharacterized protein n=1 Tax=Apiospora aurea TaxID=335848 RepID=A0ABR1Q095_9PEZI